MAVAPTTATGVDLVAREARFPRFVALILDSIIVGFITLIATNVYGVTVVTWGSPIPVNDVATWGAQTTIPWFWGAAIWIGYYFVFEAMFGATPGKALNGVVVVSADGRPLTVRRVVIRNLLRLLDALPVAYMVGAFFVAVTANSQRIGDLVARTAVVRRQRVIDASAITRSSGRPARTVLVAAVAAIVVFTAVFDYIGRPALVIQGAYNQHKLGNGQISSYSLGSPTRTLDTVTYPITATTSTGRCTGQIDLYWQGIFGWQISGSRLDCPPAR